MLEDLKVEVCRANCALVEHGLVISTWGNVSGIDREKGLVAIKPSGVPYEDLSSGDIPLVDLDGNAVEGKLQPSSDTPIHLALYKDFETIGGITHTHSTYATMFAQAGKGVPCMGTTHADFFHGEVPVTRSLTEDEVTGDYEGSTGVSIVERFSDLDPGEMPAVLVADHGPFTWGKDAPTAVESSVVLEEVAKIAWGTLTLRPDTPPISSYLLDQHFFRKHGSGAYYGQG